MQYPYDAWYLLQKAEQSVFEEKKTWDKCQDCKHIPEKVSGF